MLKYLSKAAGACGYILQYGCLTHCIFEYVGDFVVCSGQSMEPTLFTNNILITERFSPRFNGILRGDIVIAKCPTNPAQHICKRVVGLAGDRITIQQPPNFNPFKERAAITMVNSREKILPPDYLTEAERMLGLSEEEEDRRAGTTRLRTNEIIVPRGYVWIEGDNTENSSDSRHYGPIPFGLIRSRAVCRLWPLTDIKLLTDREKKS